MVTPEILKEIEELAYCYMLRDQIAIIVECNLDFDDHAVDQAFQKGRLKRKAEFNSKLIQLSNQLSSPAMNIESKIADETYLRDRSRL